jgi:hypothetical protein
MTSDEASKVHVLILQHGHGGKALGLRWQYE